MKRAHKTFPIPKSIHFWLPLGAIFVFIFLLAIINYINTREFFSNWHFADVVREGWLILVQAILTLYVVYGIIIFFETKMGKGFSVKRYIYEISSVALVGLIINIIFNFLFKKLIVIPGDAPEDLASKMHNLLIVSQVLILIAYVLITGFRSLNNLQQKQIEILKLQKEFAQTQFEVLKNQLNPHFLFNSLSVLTSLVYVDGARAETFIDKLSRTYRYLLDQREKEVVPLSQEMEFLDNFQYLLAQRYDKKLLITNEVLLTEENYFLLPHTLLILMEDIIGSSVMSLAKPLKIKLRVNNKTLLVQYASQPRKNNNPDGRNQFEALLDRYRLSNREINISEDNSSQQKTIHIPLFSQ